MKRFMNMNWYKHLKTINHHKWLVMKNCFRVGLYKQGLLHDLSKYSWAEFSVGVKYYQGDRSPNDAEREDKGYTSAWLHHKGRNKHHLEYWVDYSTDHSGALAGCKMPAKINITITAATDNHLIQPCFFFLSTSVIYRPSKSCNSSNISSLFIIRTPFLTNICVILPAFDLISPIHNSPSYYTCQQYF